MLVKGQLNATIFIADLGTLLPERALPTRVLLRPHCQSGGLSSAPSVRHSE